MSGLSGWLAHPLTRGLSLDAPRTTELRRAIIQGKPFLRKLYLEWYGLLDAMLSGPLGPVLELGAGGGFFREVRPGTVASEVFPLPGLDLTADAHHLPFRAESLSGVAMLDVLHHLHDPGAFFAEAERCLKPGGGIALVEPWVSPWSRLVWSKLHHEPFDPDREQWTLDAAGPLSSANSAMAWMIFQRDAGRFARRHPKLRLTRLRTFMPLAYLVSGGVSTRLSPPGWCYGPLRRAERVIESWTGALDCFAAIAVSRL